MSDFTVELRLAKPDEVQTIRSEAIRYLGYAKSKPDDITEQLISQCEKELLATVQARYCYARTNVSFPMENVVDIGFGNIQSKSLYKHLQNCHSVILMGATIGIGADRLIAKYNRLSPAKGVVIDALASSAIEYWCDRAELELTKDEKNHCARFSCGYGDFPLEHQRDFVSCLNLSRNLGITLSDSLLMTPTKSVTAVIGLGGKARTCSNRCMSCTNKNCIYRE
ncbi:MAG: Vitamin B12 dependent methionine synthase activation subunit [Lachnospiraceae bacterium]|nr:Vitamin B12 dependent methionine synthase activation subunit [Lachnospiraceae bacterium]